ncbi:hypothetical protein H2248_002262 [Termitomyces sp. 'cryptogamus']|nr:hypothetical protein H2248_005568 [Termitomyces sp. 'cryptogamus']KAH0578063.1 hypothetical protein H2248_005602 [Termitomyces sp. 'cryptogamus']KAH0579402.1 hypothetical protein H2248_002262 [Termitomyces sp. 'cryptogamus']
MSFDNAQITDNLSCLNSSRQLLPYPISRHEAELHWEKTRQEVRDRIAALPSSCFEKTMLEEDERFYAAFPQARQAAINAWIAQEFPDALWASSSTYEGIGCGVLPQMDTSSVHAHPVLDFFTFTLAHALIPSPSSCLQVPALLPLTIVYDASTKTIERNSSSTDHVSPTIIVLPPHSEESYAGVSPTCARRLLSRKNCPSSCKNHPSSHPRYGMPSHRLALGR